MGLRMKFNLVLTGVFVAGLALAGAIFYQMLQKNARAEILNSAGLMLANAIAIRDYTVTEIRPLLADKLADEFLPQTVPAYGATTNIAKLHDKYPNYSYKEATINPTNPRNRAADWESDIIRYFRNQTNIKEYVGEHAGATGRILYIARPITISNPGCLGCHSSPDRAPATLLAKYGSVNGFGWNLNEIVGAQIVTVPMEVPLQRAQQALFTFMLSLVGVFVIIAMFLNILLNKIVIKPAKAMATIANYISMGKQAPEFDIRGNDEIASLAKSFTRMRRSLYNAIRMLETPKKE